MIKTLLSLTLLPVAGYLYQSIATKRDEKNYPPPGDLIDVGGYPLQIYCQGKTVPGIPTVIIETGIWDCSQSWQIVQSELAAITRVCTYDRAGYGWSKPGIKPRTFEQITKELKALLEKKEIKPPFILVGHSLGGPIIRYYQSKYPEEVIGMIFVDALHQEKPAFSRTFKIACEALSYLAYFGLLRLMLTFCPPISANPQWTALMQKTYTACHRAKTQALSTCINEWDAYNESFQKLKEKARPLRNIPVTIISRDPNLPIRPGMSKEALRKTKEELEERNRQHLADSPHARYVIAQKSDHLVQLDRPDIVVQEIKRMIDATSKKI